MLPLVNVKPAPFRAKPIEAARDRVERARRARKARKGARTHNAAIGRCIGYTRDARSGKLHAVGSVVAQLGQGISLDGGLREDCLRYGKIVSRARRNLLFVVDTSGSMLSSERLAQVKGCVVSLLEDAYVKRTRVALVSFGGARARLVLPFTSSAELAAQRISSLPGGGGTPLTGALAIAVRQLDQLDGEVAEVILLSDGRYDRSKHTPSERLIRTFGAYCRRKGVRIHLIDAGAGKKTSARRVSQLAAMLQADIRTIDDLRVS